MVLRINNRTARHLWLQTNGLSATPTGPINVLDIIKKLGFVQLDTIQYVSRAHHHILWSRNQNYREIMLDKLLSEHRSVFEHFSHDASIFPMEHYPMWRRQFRRMAERMQKSTYYRTGLNKTDFTDIKNRIEREGPLSTHAFNTKISGEKKMWARPPHKLALDHMWYTGELTTSHRENFKKYYDLSERVIPSEFYNRQHTDLEQIDWLCRRALDRLAFASEGEVQRFWAATDRVEVKDWVKREDKDIVPVTVENFDGSWSRGVALANIQERLADVQLPTSRLRILNPFDPSVRDRARLERLFGFEYRIEIFVPAEKRRWGYYVYPLLEGDRFVGRIEVKADRKKSNLYVLRLWQESGIRWPASRQERLMQELGRLARFASLKNVVWP
jgi:uncharacterized protein